MVVVVAVVREVVVVVLVAAPADKEVGEALGWDSSIVQHIGPSWSTLMGVIGLQQTRSLLLEPLWNLLL